VDVLKNSLSQKSKTPDTTDSPDGRESFSNEFVDLKPLLSNNFTELTSQEVTQVVLNSIRTNNPFVLLDISQQFRQLGVGFSFVNQVDKFISDGIVRSFEVLSDEHVDFVVKNIQFFTEFFQSIGRKEYAINHRRKNEFLFELIQFDWSDHLEKMDYFEIHRILRLSSRENNPLLKKVLIRLERKQPDLFYKAQLDYEIQSYAS